MNQKRLIKYKATPRKPNFSYSCRKSRKRFEEMRKPITRKTSLEISFMLSPNIIAKTLLRIKNDGH
jgi:uncharacterized protein (DUF2062 family)